MKVVAFIEPPQVDLIEKILRHWGLWCPSSPLASLFHQVEGPLDQPLG
jgi:hypothetical protein